MTIRPLESDVERVYASIRVTLEKRGTPVSAHDVLIGWPPELASNRPPEESRVIEGPAVRRRRTRRVAGRFANGHPKNAGVPIIEQQDFEVIELAKARGNSRARFAASSSWTKL